jgi:hypothetical protein
MTGQENFPENVSETLSGNRNVATSKIEGFELCEEILSAALEMREAQIAVGKASESVYEVMNKACRDRSYGFRVIIPEGVDAEALKDDEPIKIDPEGFLATEVELNERGIWFFNEDGVSLKIKSFIFELGPVFGAEAEE